MKRVLMYFISCSDRKCCHLQWSSKPGPLNLGDFIEKIFFHCSKRPFWHLVSSRMVQHYPPRMLLPHFGCMRLEFAQYINHGSYQIFISVIYGGVRTR